MPPGKVPRTRGAPTPPISVRGDRAAAAPGRSFAGTGLGEESRGICGVSRSRDQEHFALHPRERCPPRAAAGVPPPRTHRRHRRAAANWLPLKAQGPGRLISRVFTPPLLIWRVRDIPGGSRTSREVTPISSRRLLIPAGGEPGAAAGSHQPELRQNNLAAIWSEHFGV